MTVTRHDNLSYDDYAALPGVRSSDFKRLDISPKHYLVKDDKDTASRKALRLAHLLALEPHLFERDFGINNDHRGSNVYKLAAAANPDRTLIKSKNYDQARAVADAWLTNEATAPFLAMPGESEVTITWTDPATGIECKARLDWLIIDRPTASATVCDLKQYGTVVERDVADRVIKLMAHVQAAHYVAAAEALLGPGWDIRYVLLVAESGPPYDTAAFELHADGFLYAGQTKRDELLARLRECIDTDRWPGRHPEPVELDAPSYLFPDNNADLENEPIFGPAGWAARSEA